MLYKSVEAYEKKEKITISKIKGNEKKSQIHKRVYASSVLVVFDGKQHSSAKTKKRRNKI